MTSNCLLRVFALAPSGSEGVAIAAAACRANAFGIIDLSLGAFQDPQRAFDRLRVHTARPFGVRIHAQDILSGSVLKLANHAPDAIWIPIPSAKPDQLPELAALIHGANRFAIAEATTRAEAGLARSAGFDGLILSGHESGGWCGAESSFVLLQGVLAENDLPVWVRGGIGPDVAAACIAAGAAGVVLDGALLLSRESPLSPSWRERLARSDGSETVVIVPREGASLRVFAPSGSEAVARLKVAAVQGGPAWIDEITRSVGWRDGQCAPAGQDAAFAERLARENVTTGGIVQAVEQAFGTRRLLRPPNARARALGHRHHRHGGGDARRGDRFPVLVQYAPGRRCDHRDPARPLELAALLRPRSQGTRQDHLEVGRVLCPTSRSTRFATACPLRVSPRSSPPS